MDVENVSPSIYSFNSVHCSVPFSFKLFSNANDHAKFGIIFKRLFIQVSDIKASFICSIIP
ncbi:181L [Invertebrate iridescent virus Kaz2018]|uniref:Uncharacterized protein n=1 Tax=Iridovirus sp. TaxID=135728 RepID=A0AAU7YEY8_9VIRU|nr:181L [Invertebrate iridescent virus Kaz2018]